MLKLCVYIPKSHLESVKQALFNAGAGRIGDYECCAWEVLGQGQFKPLAKASPAIGKLGKLEKVDEYQVEMVLAKECLNSVLLALKEAHPYEEPAFGVFTMLDVTLKNTH